KERYNANIWATNIQLQGLPKDIYTLINHYTDAKDIWDNVKMLLEEKERYNANIWATNILLQGLPKDIYTLINHYTDAKDILDNVKMVLEGSELTEEDHESQLYDDFEHFQKHTGELIHDYYIWFSKLINNIRNIKMTMSRMQLNSNFVNNMLPEWGSSVLVKFSIRLSIGESPKSS
nr:integrase, catalytic region, zinc finger, CCHC-type, peptidase aspartic, catalytic [Tanacetum cinerariifolium]